MADAWENALAARCGLTVGEPLKLAIFAPGVWRRRKRLREILGHHIHFQFGSLKGAAAVAGWGQKGAGRQRAEDAGIPYLALEDSFLSRLDHGEKSFGILGLIADPIGIYYNAHEPSLCEQLIQEAGTARLKPEERDQASDLIAELRRHGLGKFNRLKDDPYPENTEFHAVVVDQIAGDLSISGGNADADSFRHMLEAALDENPSGGVAVKLHPYDGLKGRTGHLRDLAERYKLPVLTSGANWIRCAGNTQKVYVVSSNAGLEALIAGSQVSCFGSPFFSGWGLTEDRLLLERRTAKPTLEELVHAVYEQYGLSWIAATSQRGSALELAQSIAATKRHHTNLSGLKVAGLQRLKQGHIQRFAGPFSVPLRAAPSVYREADAVWASRISKSDELQSVWANRERFFVEDGFIRSVGLGADLVKPQSLAFDQTGIYYDPRQSSDLERLLETEDLDDDQRRRGQQLSDMLRMNAITKYNTEGDAPDFETQGRTAILVPGQVSNDASVLNGGGSIQSNEELLAAVREAKPDAFLVYKPHPDVIDAGRPGHVPDPERWADLVLTDCAPTKAIDQVDEVHTLTSLMGFEALVRGKAVTCYGQPFYSGWGLTKDHVSVERRTRRRTIEELVYLTLIAYPYYLHPKSQLPATAEQLVQALTKPTKKAHDLKIARSIMRLWRKFQAAPEYLKR